MAGVAAARCGSDYALETIADNVKKRKLEEGGRELAKLKNGKIDSA